MNPPNILASPCRRRSNSNKRYITSFSRYYIISNSAGATVSIFFFFSFFFFVFFISHAIQCSFSEAISPKGQILSNSLVVHSLTGIVLSWGLLAWRLRRWRRLLGSLQLPWLGEHALKSRGCWGRCAGWGVVEGGGGLEGLGRHVDTVMVFGGLGVSCIGFVLFGSAQRRDCFVVAAQCMDRKCYMVIVGSLPDLVVGNWEDHKLIETNVYLMLDGYSAYR